MIPLRWQESIAPAHPAVRRTDTSSVLTNKPHMSSPGGRAGLGLQLLVSAST
jgi:hypothetical protein